jgi:hypothetical protein
MAAWYLVTTPELIRKRCAHRTLRHAQRDEPRELFLWQSDRATGSFRHKLAGQIH